MLKHRSVQVSEPDQVTARWVGSGQDLHSIAARQFACCPLGKCRCQAGAASVSDAADSNQSQSRARSAQQLWRKAKQATQGISNHRRAIDAGKTERADSSHGQAGSFVEPESLHVQVTHSNCGSSEARHLEGVIKGLQAPSIGSLHTLKKRLDRRSVCTDKLKFSTSARSPVKLCAALCFVQHIRMQHISEPLDTSESSAIQPPVPGMQSMSQ